MAIAYKAIPVAEVCYIFEITHWLALGRIPECIYDESGHEKRLSPDEHADHFEPFFEAEIFLDEDEISQFLPGVELSEYYDAQTENYGGTAEEIIIQSNELLERFEDTMDSELQAELAEKRDSDIKRAKVVQWLTSISKPIDRLVDRKPKERLSAGIRQ